jgi:hypothetical protein
MMSEVVVAGTEMLNRLQPTMLGVQNRLVRCAYAVGDRNCHYRRIYLSPSLRDNAPSNRNSESVVTRTMHCTAIHIKASLAATAGVKCEQK